MIKGINITKTFGESVLFDNYNFLIEDNDFVCFSGESGVGKTTLLNIIGLLEPFDNGELIIDGMKYTTRRQKLGFYSSKAGFLFQNFALMENKTVGQNLEIIRKRSRTDYSVAEVLERVGLSDKLHNKVYTLSGGEQQRVALARLFLKKCDIVLADEPTGSLDARNADLVIEILMELNREGKTVILVTHDEKIKNVVQKVIEL
jgi:putative ABC transport system ATP-binding protein